MDTDDLRESPNVELAERLIGKGIDVCDLRPDHQSRTARRCEPAGRRGPAAAPRPAARLARRRRRCEGRHRGRVVERALGRGRAAGGPAGAHHRPERSARARGRGSPRLRGDRLVTTRRRTRSTEVGRRRRPRVLIIIQNLAVPFDRRVWLECQSLRDAGYDVTVVCPAGRTRCPTGCSTTSRSTRTGLRARWQRRSASWRSTPTRSLATARLVLQARGRRGPFDVIQACNPPDIFWPLARLLRCRDGTRFVFDHHDLCPELYRVAVPRRADPAPTGPALPRADDVPDRRPGHLDQRVVRRDRRASRGQDAASR